MFASDEYFGSRVGDVIQRHLRLLRVPQGKQFRHFRDFTNNSFKHIGNLTFVEFVNVLIINLL